MTEKTIRRCDVCGKEEEIVVAASTMGPISFAYCKECLRVGAEPYNVMVTYISNAGKFPDDINEKYQKIVRKNLAYFNISEEQFVKDVDNTILMKF